MVLGFSASAMIVVGCADVRAPNNPAGPRVASALPVLSEIDIARLHTPMMVVGSVRTLACHPRLDPPRMRAEALQALRMQALSRGADALLDVRMALVTNRRSPCWNGVEASARVVRFPNEATPVHPSPNASGVED